MDARLTAFLDDLHRAGIAHDAQAEDRRSRFRNLEPASGALLAVLVRAMRVQSALELGTSNGYSTIWLAEALRATGGHLTSVDLDPTRSGLAAANLRQVGLERQVDLRIADAADVLRQSDEGAFDFVFLDAERPAYLSYWPDLLRVLRPQGLLVVDNVASHASELAEFLGLVAATAGVRQALAPTGAGLLLIVRG